MPGPIPEPLVEAALGTRPVARLASLGPGGRPHLVPVVFAASGGALWTPVDAKPKRGGELARVRHVRRDPRVALLLDRYDANWGRLWWIRVDGRAELCRAEAGAGPEARAAAALAAKYPQYRTTGLFRDDPLLIRIAVDAVASWYAGPGALEDLRVG